MSIGHYGRNSELTPAMISPLSPPRSKFLTEFEWNLTESPNWIM